MKKILLATTMLAGTAGFAAAEVAVTGYAEMGIWSNTAGDVAFHQDVEVIFNMSGTTDGGLEFGANIELDEGNVANHGDRNGSWVYISGAFGKLTMGDTDGAMDWALADSGSLTSLTDDHTSHIGYFGNGTALDGQGDGQVVRYENTFGDFSFAISAEQEDNGAAGGADDIIGIGVQYNADLGGTTLNVGLAYQTGNMDNPFDAAGVPDPAGFDQDGSTKVAALGDQDQNVDAVGVSIGATMANGFSANLGYVDYSFDVAAQNDFTHTGLGLNYTTGALAMNLNYGVISPDVGSDVDSWGLAVNYDLGGGAVVMAGYASDMSVAAGSQDQWSLGLGMSF